jgi:hypothetical protein
LQSWGSSPIGSAEGHLDHPLARAEAVEDGAAWEALLTEAVVDAAFEVRAQV